MSKDSVKTPYEKFFDNEPNFSNLKEFGVGAYVMIPHQKRKKLDPKAEKLAFVGYDGWSKAYRLANVKQQKIIVSRDVVFLKEKFMKINQNSSHEMKRSSGDLVPFPFSSGSTIDVQTGSNIQ